MTNNATVEQGSMIFQVEEQTMRPEFSQTSQSVSGLWFDTSPADLPHTAFITEAHRTSRRTYQHKFEMTPTLRRYKQEITDYEGEFHLEILKLYSLYVFNRPQEVKVLLRRNRALATLLIELAAPLLRHFGQSMSPRLSVDSSGDEDPFLRVAIWWPGDAAQADDAMAKFDEEYWLENCVRAAGSLVVVYDLV